MRFLLGFDPGGENAFGWAVVADAERPPLRVVATGVASSAREAFAATRTAVADAAVVGVGVDAPLYWSETSRVVDEHVRRAVCALGGHPGTVAHPNSLRGACLVQGAIVAQLCEAELRNDVPITEAHPKALARLLFRCDAAECATHLRRIFDDAPAWRVDHVRDAALAAYTAWAAVHRPEGWRNLVDGEQGPVVRLLRRREPAYWMPSVDTTASAQPARAKNTSTTPKRARVGEPA